MPIEIPESSVSVENRAKTDVQRELPEANPFLKNSWLSALITAYSHRVFDFYTQLRAAIRENLPDTATTGTGGLLLRWASIFGIQRLAATRSTGNVLATGTAGTSIPADTVFTTPNGNYVSINTATITSHSISVLVIIRSGQTATVTTINDHGLANNVPVTITGGLSDDILYNVVDVPITVTGLDTFEYQVTGSPATPSTSTILATFTSGSVKVESSFFGSIANLDAGNEVNLQSPIAGVDDSLAVDFGTLGGGSDQEIDEGIRLRMLDKIQNPVAHFNVSDIINKVKEVAGITRVFVQKSGTIVGFTSVTSITRVNDIATVTLVDNINISSGQAVTITNAADSRYNVVDAKVLVQSGNTFHYIVSGNPETPAAGTISSSVSIAAGTVTLYVMRDNDVNTIPSASDILAVKDKLTKIIPANTASSDVVVLAPIPAPIDFTFTQVSPDTATMKSAITANLKVFFEEDTEVGEDVKNDAFRSAIFNTVDTETGAEMKSFTLSAPVTDMPINIGEIGILGNVTFV